MLESTKNHGLENRFILISSVILLIGALLGLRLWYVQIFKGEYYATISDSNRFRQIDISAPRGVFYDRDGHLLLGNRPYHDLTLVPQYSTDTERTLEQLSKLLNIPYNSLDRRLQMFRGQPKFLPVVLKRNLSKHEVAIVQSNKIHLPGVEIQEEPRRQYGNNIPAHLFGYVGEIDKPTLEKMRERYPKLNYQAGDLIGKQGLESAFESYLRGLRGEKYIQIDAFGRQIDNHFIPENRLEQTKAKPGSSIITTLSERVQAVTLNAIKGKNGAVIVLNPQNGEILAMASEPSFNPGSYQDGISKSEWAELTSNPFHPLLDKTTGGLYSPGSLFKALVGIAALEEGVVTPQKTFFCPGHFTIGNKTIHCHERQGHGHVNLFSAIMHSCDVYFYYVGIELGIDRIAEYAREFGLGNKLELGINMELEGIIPSSDWKRKSLGQSWAIGDTPNVSIGQGFLLMTPLQMAAMYSVIATEGKLFRPHIVRRIVNYFGDNIFETKPELIAQTKRIKPENFKIMKQALREVVMHQSGTGRRARVDNVEIAGKTGTVQVTSLSKNKTTLDVSMRWREHAMFAAFSPVENPEVLVIVVSEHDSEGGGGKSAAPIAGKIIDEYWKSKAEKRLRHATNSQKETKTNEAN